MSNRERCISMLNNVSEQELNNVLAYLQNHSSNGVARAPRQNRFEALVADLGIELWSVQ